MEVSQYDETQIDLGGAHHWASHAVPGALERLVGEGMKRTAVLLMLLCMLTVTASAAYVPEDVVSENRDGRQLIIKTYTLPPDADPSELIEEPFELEGYTYHHLETVKEEQAFKDSKAQTEVVTLETNTDDLAKILEQLAPTMEYNKDGYSGTLTLDHTTIQTEAAGYTTKYYTITDTKQFPGLSRNDPSCVPTTTVKNGSKPIANVKFEIKSVDGSYGPEEFTTDENGEIDLSKLPAGAYVVTELECPGYVIDKAQRIIQLKPNEDAQFVFTNTIKPSLQLIKTSADGSLLAGVTFRIAKIEDGSHYLDRTTNSNGEILISDLEPGVYSVRETATLEDHLLDTTEHHVELFPGQTSTIVLENDRRPSLTIHKNDADTGEPVEGVVFTVKAADGSTITEVKTGPDGTAKLENLLSIVYEVIEKSVPEPYLLDAPSQLITLYPNKDSDIYFENHKKPSLTIEKIDSITGDPIKGAKFQIWYGSNNTETGELNDLGTYYTDADGRIVLENVNDGWFKVTELEPAPGYQIKDPATQECFIEAGTSKTLVFENTPLSALIVYKYDSVTGEPVANAVFQVKYLSGTSGTGGTVIGTYKTSVNGSFTVTGLKAGTYIVEELASDSGHVIDTAPQTAYISGKDQDVVELYFGNSPKGSLLIKKIDSKTHKPLSDVQFFVTESDGTVVGDGNGYFTTDSQGTILIEGIDPGTTLVVKETIAKDGYLLDDTPQTAKIQAGQTVTLEFRNQPKGGLIINKLDSVTRKPLEGVEFEIT